MRIRLAQSALPASTQHIRRSGAHEKPSADSSELHARGSRSARIRDGRPYATRGAAPATAGRPARGTAARMRCATFPAARPDGPHTPAALTARAREFPEIHPPAQVPPPAADRNACPRCPPDTPGSRSTRVPARAPGSAPHAKPEWAPRGPCPWPSVEKPTVRTDRPDGPDAVRYSYTSVDTATYRPAATYRIHGVTRRKRSCGRVSEPGGRFRRWWQVLGSNQRRLSRRFTDRSPSPEPHAADRRICRPSSCLRPPPSARRPCAAGLGGHGREQK